VGRHDAFEYLDELQTVLASFPRLTIVWAHCGISRRVWHKSYTGMLSQLLRTHQHLHLDLSWIVYDDVVCYGSRRKLVPHPRWLGLIRTFPDRFLIGSDLLGHFDHLDAVLARYQGLLDALSDPIVEQVAFQNADRIWFQP
jgi:predicted TIM-barrel fold metal-dependent hydrolase